MRGWFYNNRWLILTLVVALGVRLLLLVVSHDTKVVFDEVRYVAWANQFSKDPQELFNLPIPPLYSIFIAAIFMIFGKSLIYVRLAQIIISTATVFLVYRIGEEAFGKRAGFVIGLITALYPSLVFLSNHFWSETLFVFFLYLSALMLIGFEKDGSALKLFLTGVFLGLATLTRGTSLFIIVFISIWLCVRYRKQLVKIPYYLSAAVLGMLVVTAPMKLTKSSVETGFNGPVILYNANNVITGYDWNKITPEKQKLLQTSYLAMGENSEERDKEAMRLALKYIWDEQPGWFFKKLYYNMPRLFSFDSLELRHISMDLYGETANWQKNAALIVLSLVYLILLLSASTGMIYSKKNFAAYVMLFLILYYIAIHVPTITNTRYRIPFVPAMIVFAGVALVNLREYLGRFRKNPLNFRGVALICLLAVIAVHTYFGYAGVYNKMFHLWPTFNERFE